MKKIVAIASASVMLMTGVSFAETAQDAVPGVYLFMSGAGAWRNEMTVNADMSFGGVYSDSEMGDIGEGYEYGSCYISVYDGAFADFEDAGNGTYTMKVASISYQNEPGTEEIEDEIRYVYDEAYGIGANDEFIYYPKGFATENVDPGALEWVALVNAWGDEIPAELPEGVLYNASQGYAFVNESFED